MQRSSSRNNYRHMLVRRLDNPALKHVAMACRNPYPRPNGRDHRIPTKDDVMYWVTSFTLHKEEVHLVSFMYQKMHQSDSLVERLRDEGFFLVFYKGKAYNVGAEAGKLIVHALQERMLPEIYCLLHSRKT